MDGDVVTNPAIGNFKLLRGSTDITGMVTIVQGFGEVIVTFNAEEEVPAGVSYDYTLNGTGNNFRPSANGDDSVTTGLSRVLWSDNSALAHDCVLGQLSADWFGQLYGLPLPGTVVTAK